MGDPHRIEMAGGRDPVMRREPFGQILDGLAFDLDAATGVGSGRRQDVHGVCGHDAWKGAHAAQDRTIELKPRFVFVVSAFREGYLHRHQAVWVVTLVGVSHPHGALDAQPRGDQEGKRHRDFEHDEQVAPPLPDAAVRAPPTSFAKSGGEVGPRSLEGRD